ncbi:MAG: hypothetical protein WA091_00640 [Minisyncoccales bacterium]
MLNEKEEVPLDYFYINVDHWEIRNLFHNEGDFGDYLLMLRYRSGKRNVHDIGKMRRMPFCAR